MSYQPFAHLESLRIGTVDFVSPDEVKVLLDTEAPETVALNAGGVRPFPRVNGYVLLPVEDAYLVGQIEWLTIERSNFAKRGGKDSELIDLPYPLRKMSVAPLGTLRRQIRKKDGRTEERYEFRRGSDALPSLGSSVLLPTDSQLRAIVESGDNKRVKIGTSPMAGNAEVKVDPDRLFGRHLAVLGNTGSGKSCSVAGLVRWSLEAAQNERGGSHPNARFIILDPNGEYAKAFQDDAGLKARIFKVGGEDAALPLKVPLWFWNSAEWCAFTQASGRAQRPLLLRALREIKNGTDGPSDKEFELRRRTSTILVSIKSQIRSGDNYEGWKFGPKLGVYTTDFEAFANEYPAHVGPLNEIKDLIHAIISAPGRSYQKRDGTTGYNDFPASVVIPIIDKIQAFLSSIGGVVYQSGPSEDTPVPFDGEALAEHIEGLANQENNPQFFDFLVMRIRTMLADTRMKTITGDISSVTLDNWLGSYIGANDATNGNLTVIDLSLLPTEAIHIVTAVIARIVFEALQRYRKMSADRKSLPTVLVMEEAHTFIKRYKDEADNYDSSAICCQVFERIAREGRKFGLGLVLSSQRPSELSPTVLSQCNTFLLHRISNDKDQEQVNKLVPDNLRGLLRELPSLPSQHAILLGWASELPVLVKMQDLPVDHRPHSDDPHFWNVWTGAEKRPVEWKAVADDWQEYGTEDPLPPIANGVPAAQSGDSPA